MIIYFIKMILRSWWRNLLSTSISLASLVVGIACSAVLILYVLGEYRISKGLGDTEGVYLLKSRDVFYDEGNAMTDYIYKNIPPLIADRFPEVESWCALASRDGYEWGEVEPYNENIPTIYAVTSGFIDMFDIPVEEGNLAQTLSRPNEIALTRSYARLYFGIEEPMGREVVAKVDEWDSSTGTSKEFSLSFTVTTILGDNDKTPLFYAGFYAMPEGEVASEPVNNQAYSYIGFLKLRTGIDNESFTQKVMADTLVVPRWDDELTDSLALVAADQIYFDENNTSKSEEGALIKSSNPLILYVGLSVALAILVMACFNYLNLTMIRSAQRLKNIAGQRIMGAPLWAVRVQTVLDTALMVLVALLFAMSLMEYILPLFNGFMGSSIEVLDIFDGVNAAVIVGLLLMVVLLSSLFVLVKLESRDILKSFKNPTGNRMRFARTMVIAQFVMSVVLVTVSICVTRQMDFVARTIPNAERIVQIRRANFAGPLSRDFVDQAKVMAGVDASQTSSIIPSQFVSQGGFNCSFAMGDAGYLDFFDIKIIEGRALEPTDTDGQVLVNEVYVRRKEWDEPLGQEFHLNGQDCRVVGVMEDYMIDNAGKAIQAQVFSIASRQNLWRLSLKLNGNVRLRIEELRKLWKQLEPNEPMPEFTTIEQQYRDMNPEGERLSTIVNVFAVIGFLLTSMGLFGLAWYSVAQRGKEIALRKVHGATIREVVLLLCRHFMGWMLAAVVIALPLAWWLSTEWLKSFVYKVPLAWWIFVVAALLAVMVTLLTVIFQSIRAATTNPVKALKTDA